jgi:ribosomal-protein-alanine N-acetyltransferase
MRADDFDALCRILQDIDVMYAWEHAFSDEEVAAWIDANLARYDSDGYGYWAVEEKSTGEIIGLAGLLSETAGGEKCVGLGYIFARAHWGRGCAFEAASACRDYAFGALGLEELTAQIRPENTPSRALAEKLGMQARAQFVKR